MLGCPCALDSVTTYHFCAPSWTADFQPPADRVLCVKCPSAHGACSVSSQDRKYQGINTSSPPSKGSSQPMTARNSLIIYRFQSTNILVVCLWSSDA